MVRYGLLSPQLPGIYTYGVCLASTFMVSYTCQKKVSVPYLQPYLPDCANFSFLSLTADVIAPVEREIRSLAIGLTSVKDEQEYIVVRERRHRDTAESTCDRVKWWSVLQALVLFAVVAWQVYYLKVCCNPSFASFCILICDYRASLK
jgi:hypothetical protein